MGYRRFVILLINALILFWLFRIIYNGSNTDFFGIFYLGVLLFIAVYNIYALIVFNYFPENVERSASLEIWFCVALIIPFFLFLLAAKFFI